MAKKTLNGVVRAAASEPTKRAVLYLRVSSKRQMDTDADFDADGNSIDTQRKWTTQKAKELGVVVVGEYVEPGNSAQTIAKRPVFRDMMRRIEEEQDVEYVIIYQRSRAFRNYTDAAIVKRDLRARGIELMSAKENFGEGIMADAMEAVTDIFNEVQVRLSGEDIKTKMANKARNGGTIGRAPVGYLNVRKRIDGREVRTIGLDPERAKYIPMAFNLMATGLETLTSLQGKLTDAGFRMPPIGKSPAHPISIEKLRNMLRDRYYLGYVEYDGIEFKGRHEALVNEELFGLVQRVLDNIGEKHIRHRTHSHYLKGLFWCARCDHRFTVQRAQGRHGGAYFYFLCRGRQQGLCDMPYIPVEVLEEAVERYYEHAVELPADFRDMIRAGADEATTTDVGLDDAMRGEYTGQLDKLERKENYFLDLAAEEGWPKDKLRSKIDAIRTARSQCVVAKGVPVR